MNLPWAPKQPRATVVIPTFGPAPFLRHAIASAQAQTIRELEICVILDGSPQEMDAMVEDLAAKDRRIRPFHFSKASRTGEIHRAEVIPLTSGRIICYLSHDDVWFPNHVEVVERELAGVGFTHTLHAVAGLGEAFGEIIEVLWGDLSVPEIRQRMLHLEQPINYFGLSCGAHTREAYLALPEGWSVTPQWLPTDLGMWRKFLSSANIRSSSIQAVTSLHFPAPLWTSTHSADAFSLELERYQQRLKDSGFVSSLQQQVFRLATARLIQAEAKLAECVADPSARELRLVEGEVNRRIRELPARKIWKLVWKRLTRQWVLDPDAR